MNLGDHLVGISTYDRGRPDVGGRPAVGDYETVDWEQLAAIKPDRMVIQIAPDHLSDGFKHRARAMHIELVVVKIDNLDDIFHTMGVLSDDLFAVEKGGVAMAALQKRLDTVRARSTHRPPVPALIALDPAGVAVAGTGSFLDELLTIGGGVNAAAKLHTAWPTIDDETLRDLKPQVVIVLLPDASPQSVEQAKAAWARRTFVPAVANGHVYVLTSWYALLPGWHVADLADSIATCLQPIPTSRPTSQR